jgi:RNA exonuclease 1
MSHRDHHEDRPRSRGKHGQGKKRKHEQTVFDGMGQTLSLLRQPDLPEFNLTSARAESEGQDDGSPKESKEDGAPDSEDWQTIENGRPKKKAKKIPKAHSANYPAIKFSYDSRLQSQIKISDVQNLVLYILADGTSPQFVSVKHRPEIRKVVVLMVPGLEKSMFIKEKKQREDDRNYSPDDYYPVRLRPDEMPVSLEAFADMFEDLWPVKTPGDDKFGKMHSPLHAILTAPLPKDKEEKNFKKNKRGGGGGVQPVKEPAGWKNSRTPITEFIHTPEELLENDYTLHPAAYDGEVDKADLLAHRIAKGVSQEHGWVDTSVKSFDDGVAPDNEIEQGSLTAGRDIFAMDCEMCMTGEGEFALTRISIVGWDGSVVLDELVKPAKPITNYVTQ